MLDKSQWKTSAIRFGRALQMLFKNATMFSAAHPAVQTAIANTFELLNVLVKESGQFTIGFVDDRVLLNNLLTSEKTLSGLENEFLKRGIGALSFEPGITLAAYRRAVTVIVRAPNVSETDDPHALTIYLGQNPMDFVRVHPAPRGQKRAESGDTILEMDSESYLMAKAFADIRTPGLERVDSFLRTVGIGGIGTGEGFTGTGSSPGLGAGIAGANSDGGGSQLSAFAAGVGEARPHEQAEGQTFKNGLVEASQGFSPGGPSGITSMVESYLCSSLAESDSGPQRSYLELAKLIKETRPEFVLASFSPQRREELRRLPPEQMAEEVIEDTALKWAAERLVASPTGSDAMIVEQEVIRVLIRTLQTTQTASRLAEKLARYIEEFKIPTATHTRIREELEWTVVPSDEKSRRLLAIEHYGSAQFRRLILHIPELIKAGKQEAAAALAEHFFYSITSDESPNPEELGRVHEFVISCGNLRPDSWKSAAERLLVKLATPLDAMRHCQLVNGLHAITQVLARYESFEMVNEVGAALEAQKLGGASHDACCKPALNTLLTTHVLDRILEIYLQKRDDHGLVRVAPALLRRAGAAGIARVFHELENQQSASGRISLLRLITRIGAPALEFATERLKDERWYVVRNACKVLTDLHAPKIVEQLGPLLRHEDERVQKAALTGVIDSRLPGRAVELAKHLPYLRGVLLEDAATELIYLRDTECIRVLGAAFANEPRNVAADLAAVQVLATMAHEDAGTALLQVILNGGVELGVRRTALKALLRKTGPKYTRELAEFTALHSSDPISPEVQTAVASLGSAR